MTDEILKPDGLASDRLGEIQEYEMGGEPDAFFRRRLAYGRAPVFRRHERPPAVEPLKVRGEDGEWVEL